MFDFPKGNPGLLDFPKTRASGSRPPDTNPPVTSILSPQPNFNFGGNMEANQPWLTIDVLSIPGAPHPLPRSSKNLFPKFDPDKDVLPKHHIKQFMLALMIMNVENEDVVCRSFPYTFQGKEYHFMAAT